jgi:hypothetical protein
MRGKQPRADKYIHITQSKVQQELIGYTFKNICCNQKGVQK